MKLVAIRLSGFKSFADNTVFPVNAPVTGIIGPNGCGKSNIIDAVKWVLGESAAKQLRGQFLTDVIFAGSKSRKPSGLATVELHFENNDNRSAGPFSQYKEIVLQRTVTSDGQSTFRINKQRCRRKDLIELLQGTGVGARSYAVIEQGMISRIVESKPEDLRSFIEEAAGIAVYKSRRKDTCRKLDHVRENLIRHDDRLEILKSQRNKLGQEAEIARQYQDFQKELNELNKQLELWRLQQLRSKRDEIQRDFAKVEKQYADALATLAEKKREIEKCRNDNETISSKYQRSSNEKQKIAAEKNRQLQKIKEYRQQIVFYEENREKLKVRKQRIQAEQSTNTQQIQEWQAALNEISDEIRPLQNQLSMIESSAQDAELEKIQAEIRYREQKRNIEQIQQKMAYAEKSLKEKRYYIDNLNRKIDENKKQSFETSDGSIVALKNKYEAASNDVKTFKAEIENRYAAIEPLRAEIKNSMQELQRSKTNLASNEAKLATLKKWRPKGNKRAQHNDKNIDYLYENISIDKDWRPAIEKYLASALNSSCEPGSTYENAWVDKGKTAAAWKDIIDTDYDIGAFFDHLLPLNKEDETIDKTELLDHQYYLSKSGSIVCRNAYFPIDDNQQEGLFERLEQEKALLALISQQKKEITENEKLLVDKKEKCEKMQRTLQEKQQAEKSKEKSRDQLRQQIALEEKELAHQRGLKARQNKVLESLDQELKIEENKLKSVESDYALYQRQISEGDDLVHLKNNMKVLQRKYNDIYRDKYRLNESNNRLVQKQQTANFKLENALQQQQRLASSFREINQEYENLDQSFMQVNQQLTVTELDYSKTVAIEENEQVNWADIEEEYHALRMQLQEKEHELQGQVYQEQLIKEKRNYQHERVEAQQLLIEQKVAQLSAESIEITDGIKEINDAALSKRVKQLKKAIAQLGNVNMTAIDDFSELEKEYQQLQQQCEDLHQSITLLETAIAELDQETKNRLKDTFEHVSGTFSKLCTSLFKGGEASISWTSNNILEAGIDLQVRPPGKKVKNLSALSGGEKALTAVALVFSFFTLNPAPFCLLDEIDAPLDDANVKRLCDLLREMSVQTQFIMITHHRASMQACDHLIGVTMSEPGVSRLVTVKIKESES